MNANGKFNLLSPLQADPLAAAVVQADGTAELSVSEERAFGRQWLSLGQVNLVASDLNEVSAVKLVQRGAYEWKLPGLSTAVDHALKLVGLEKSPSEDAPARDQARIRRAMDEVTSIATRIGLVHPSFDPAALEQMPFRRSTTVVVDTSGVLQGALDFVARFLHPAARIKIPAIAQMEIANQADRFLRIRRSRNNKPNVRMRELFEHLMSQGGQRALLRTELHGDTEVERTYLLGDPLRSAFSKDSDPDVRDLDINSPIRSYADRLILEAARHHQAQSGPAHVVRLLTGDQGLARMAIAEGVRPVYFRANSASKVFGQRLSGQTLDPFLGHVRGVPLTTLLWELATGFGSARLKSQNKELQVSAIGEQLSWAPYHAEQDLLWCRELRGTVRKAESKDAKTAADQSADRRTPERVPKRRTPAAKRGISPLRFNVDRLFRLVCTLDDRVDMPVPQVEAFLRSKANEYGRFLQSGGMIRSVGGMWTADERIQFLSAALRNERVEEVRGAMLDVPSYAAFAERLKGLAPGEPLEAKELGRGAATYRVLGEVTLICASVASSIYATGNEPSPEEFAAIARDRFSSLNREGGDLVATGEWLEALIREDGIHPEVARQQLDAASEAGLLRRSTEGSTSQLRFRDRVVHVLRSQSGEPAIEEVFLYRGDYLIPGKASVSLRIEDPIS